MSALAIILAAVMVVPADGPEKASGEIAKPLRLDLRGKWEFECEGVSVSPISGEELIRRFGIQDEGGGRLRMAVPKFGKNGVFIPYTGTYSQEKDRVLIHFHISAQKDSAVYRDNLKKGCIVLNRLKPGN
jgi:hypothetical protein